MTEKWKGRAISVSFSKTDKLNPQKVRDIIRQIVLENKDTDTSELTKASLLKHALEVGIPIVARERYGVEIKI